MTDNTTNNSDITYLLEEGMTIDGKWEIQNFIAKGGKGEVYLTRQLSLNRQVALKIMSQDFIQSLEEDEEEITSETMRFQREVQVMARMQHPNILKVYDFDQLEIDGMELDYIVMEYVPGPTLRQKMPEKGFGHDEKKVKKWLKKYFFPILEGMKAVHDKGVIHRDMKPENVLIDDGLPKIMDFGIAGGHHMDNVTQTHHMLGTMKYMPEEQFMDLALTDARVDVYALGKILYEIIEGKMKKGRDKPFNSSALNNPKTIFFKTLDHIIQQATAKNRNHRIPSVKSLKDSLEDLVMDSEEKKIRPKALHHKYWKYLFAASIAIIIIIIITVVMHHDPKKTTPVKNHIQKPEGIKINMPASFSLPEFNFKNPQPTILPRMDKKSPLPEMLFSSDDTTMILVTGADVTMSIDDPTTPKRNQMKKTMPVDSIYMDRVKVTNYLYARFLNKLDSIEVKHKSVLLNGKLLLLLGEVREGYEPILFRDGKFTVNPEDVSKPVVRVTPVGALAYASFYGKSLPLMEQWWLAVQSSGNNTPRQADPSPYQNQMMMMDKGWVEWDQLPEEVPLDAARGSDIQPITRTSNKENGIQGLEQNVNEWTMSFAADGSLEFHIHGGIGELGHTESYLERQPWEAFSSVGFRTVLNLNRRK